VSAWLRELARLRAVRTEAVVVTVLSVRGSTPREAGAKMIVTAHGIHGSIGGGRLEFDVIALARTMLGTTEQSRVHRFVLGAVLGQCCGGLAELFFEPVTPRSAWVDELLRDDRVPEPCVLVRPLQHDGQQMLVVRPNGTQGSVGDAVLDAAALQTAGTMLAAPHPQIASTAQLVFEPLGLGIPTVLLFGAGHVGRAVVRTLDGVSARIRWIDSRREQFPQAIPENVAVCCTGDLLDEVQAAPPGSDFLVMTHSHVLDFELAVRILERGDFGYFGLIGSKTKRRSFESRFAQRGIAADRIARMCCPIGIAGITSKNPAAVAIAVAAQLLRAQEQARSATEVHVGNERGGVRV